MASRLRLVPRRRRFGVVLATAAIAASSVAAAPSASAATQIGETFAMSFNFCGADTLLQSGSPGGQYAAPFAGVLTSWSFTAGPTPPQRKLKVARPAGGNSFTIVGESELKAPTPNALNSYPVRIAVHPGEVIGFFQSTAGSCGARGSGPDYSFHYVSGGDPAPGTTTVFAGPNSNTQWDIAAILEPDCDSDDFGDETQDADISSCQPQPKAERTLILDAEKSKVKKGKKVTLAGQLDALGNEAACEAGQTVELQRKKPSQTVFATVQQLQTTATGNFSAKAKIKKTYEYQAVVAESAECQPGVSNTEKVKVQKKK